MSETPRRDIYDQEAASEIQGLFPDAQILGDDDFSHSLHQVFSAVVSSSDVVVKPFKGEALGEYVHREAKMCETAKQCGIETVTPLYLCIGSRANYLLTRYEHELQPLDQIKLDRLPKGEYYSLMQDIGSTVGVMHGNGIVHINLELKNLFRTPILSGYDLTSANSRVGILDWHSSKVFDDYEDPKYNSGCIKDLRDLYDSIHKNSPTLNPLDYKLAINDAYDNPRY